MGPRGSSAPDVFVLNRVHTEQKYARCGPSSRRASDAPAARKNFVHHPRNTFSTAIDHVQTSGQSRSTIKVSPTPSSDGGSATAPGGEMPMRTVAAIMTAALLSATSASAQIVTQPQPQPSAFGTDPTIRITAQFRARIEGVTDPREVPDGKAQEAARRALYAMAANECATLSEIWKAECRVSGFSVVAAAFPLSNIQQPPVPSMTGTATFELRVRTPGR
jgi:hypothetical protein